MIKHFSYHTVPITIRPYDDTQYLLSARIKNKWVEVLTKEKSIYDFADREHNTLATERNVSKHYAQHIIGYAKHKAYRLLTRKYSEL